MITRQEYMAQSTFREGETCEEHNKRCAAAHREYYAQFVTEQTIATVVNFIGADRILKSTDPHMNDIPLANWDRVSSFIPMKSFKQAGDYATLGGLVCVAKEAAKQWKEQNT